MIGTRTLVTAVGALLAGLVVAGCGDMTDFPAAPVASSGCTTACTAAPTDLGIPTPVPVPTLDPALVTWRTMVHDRVSGLMKDLDAIGGCGGSNGDDRSDCHQKILALVHDAQAMRSAVTAPPVPPDATDDAGKITDALDQLLQGCAHDAAALASNQWVVWLPGHATSEAFQALVSIDDGLRTG